MDTPYIGRLEHIRLETGLEIKELTKVAELDLNLVRLTDRRPILTRSMISNAEQQGSLSNMGAIALAKTFNHLYKGMRTFTPEEILQLCAEQKQVYAQRQNGRENRSKSNNEESAEEGAHLKVAG